MLKAKGDTRGQCSAGRALGPGGLTALWVDSVAACGYAKSGAGQKGERKARK